MYTAVYDNTSCVSKKFGPFWELDFSGPSALRHTVYRQKFSNRPTKLNSDLPLLLRFTPNCMHFTNWTLVLILNGSSVIGAHWLSELSFLIESSRKSNAFLQKRLFLFRTCASFSELPSYF